MNDVTQPVENTQPKRACMSYTGVQHRRRSEVVVKPDNEVAEVELPAA